MNKQRTVFFFLLVFFPLIVSMCFSFPLVEAAFQLSIVILFAGGLLSIPWALMWGVNVIRRLYDNMDAYLFDGDWIEIDVFDEHFENGKKSPKYLSFWEYLRLRLLGELYLFTKKREGDAGANRFYIARCSVHNIYFVDYKHGNEEVFHCPKCSAQMGL